jgi:hypothetical protein
MDALSVPARILRMTTVINRVRIPAIQSGTWWRELVVTKPTRPVRSTPSGSSDDAHGALLTANTAVYVLPHRHHVFTGSGYANDSVVLPLAAMNALHLTSLLMWVFKHPTGALWVARSTTGDPPSGYAVFTRLPPMYFA